MTQMFVKSDDEIFASIKEFVRKGNRRSSCLITDSIFLTELFQESEAVETRQESDCRGINSIWEPTKFYATLIKSYVCCVSTTNEKYEKRTNKADKRSEESGEYDGCWGVAGRYLLKLYYIHDYNYYDYDDYLLHCDADWLLQVVHLSAMLNSSSSLLIPQWASSSKRFSSFLHFS